jgi:hypothetical protein
MSFQTYHINTRFVPACAIDEKGIYPYNISPKAFESAPHVLALFILYDKEAGCAVGKFPNDLVLGLRQLFRV